MFQLLWFYNVKPTFPSPNFLFFRTIVATPGTSFFRKSQFFRLSVSKYLWGASSAGSEHSKEEGPVSCLGGASAEWRRQTMNKLRAGDGGCCSTEGRVP